MPVSQIVAANADLPSRIHDQQLDTHLAEAARLGSLLGLSTRELQGRLRDAAERLADAGKERT